MNKMTDRLGKTYKHKPSGAICLCTESLRMSAGTMRHTLLVVDACATPQHATGEITKVDEVPHTDWEMFWEEV